jgi:cell wall-associated NlpC family hydrolase
MTADEIIAAARAELGTPFVHQGRLPGKALDCIGLAIVVARTWHTVEDTAAYGRSPLNGLLQAGFDAHPLLERIAQPEPGCILLMRFGKNPQHVAICAGETVIHSYGTVGKVVEHRFSDVWRARVVRSYRLRGIE